MRFSSPRYSVSIRYSVLHFVFENYEIMKAGLLARARVCMGVCVRVW